jgi:glutamate/tyrosine decarboxylase-like PLP-dependent enzyme
LLFGLLLFYIGDGILNPGGSISNLYAIQAARHHFFPEIKANGLFGSPKLIIFTSEHVKMYI